MTRCCRRGTAAKTMLVISQGSLSNGEAPSGPFSCAHLGRFACEEESSSTTSMWLRLVVVMAAQWLSCPWVEVLAPANVGGGGEVLFCRQGVKKKRGIFFSSSTCEW